MYSDIRKEKIRNEIIYKMVEIALIDDKFREWRLKWLEYVQRKLNNALVWRSNFIHAEGKRGKNRSKFIWKSKEGFNIFISFRQYNLKASQVEEKDLY